MSKAQVVAAALRDHDQNRVGRKEGRGLTGEGDGLKTDAHRKDLDGIRPREGTNEDSEPVRRNGTPSTSTINIDIAPRTATPPRKLKRDGKEETYEHTATPLSRSTLRRDTPRPRPVRHRPLSIPPHLSIQTIAEIVNTTFNTLTTESAMRLTRRPVNLASSKA